MTRTEHHGTDPRNRLCSCPSRVHRHLCAYRQHLHMDPFPLPAFQTLQQLCKVRNPAREEISPPSTRQLCLADLPHPELNPQHSQGNHPQQADTSAATLQECASAATRWKSAAPFPFTAQTRPRCFMFKQGKHPGSVDTEDSPSSSVFSAQALV